MSTLDGAAGSLHQAYRFALDPTPVQERALANYAGAGRVAFNRMLAEVKADLNVSERTREAAWVEGLSEREGIALARARPSTG